MSVTAPACVGQVYGLGFDGYLRAMDYFLGADKLCVIGDPVAHSKSPAIQNAMLTALGLKPCYGKIQVKRGGLPVFLDKIKSEGYWGFNATMPHKEALLPLLDEVDETARRIGSVNTVCVRGGKLYGHSTDGPGFLAALKDELGVDPAGKKITLLGAGGAARAVAAALLDAGAEAICVCNRHQARAEQVCAMDPKRLIPAGFAPLILKLMAEKSDILVNCTSLGMKGEFEDLGFLAALPMGAAVCDLVYEPAETALLKEARRMGQPAMNGLGMLVYQAVLSLEHFLGRELDRKEMVKVVRAAIGGH